MLETFPGGYLCIRHNKLLRTWGEVWGWCFWFGYRLREIDEVSYLQRLILKCLFFPSWWLFPCFHFWFPWYLVPETIHIMRVQFMGPLDKEFSMHVHNFCYCFSWACWKMLIMLITIFLLTVCPLRSLHFIPWTTIGCWFHRSIFDFASIQKLISSTKFTFWYASAHF